MFRHAIIALLVDEGGPLYVKEIAARLEPVVGWKTELHPDKLAAKISQDMHGGKRIFRRYATGCGWALTDEAFEVFTPLCEAWLAGRPSTLEESEGGEC